MYIYIFLFSQKKMKKKNINSDGLKMNNKTNK